MTFRTMLFEELARIRAKLDDRRRHEQAMRGLRAAQQALADAQRKAAQERRQVAMLREARAALVNAGLSREAATTALIEIDHRRVPHVHITYE